jgi:hypothetical protein
MKLANKYCSIKCHTESQKSTYTKTCLRCGKKFILKNRAYEKRGKGKYCSSSCSSRKYVVNEKYFLNIDSEQKAYWLGFIAGDGYNSGYELVMRLNKKDANHLEAFRTAIEADHQIKFVPNNIAAIRIGSKSLCQSLSENGCVKAKTFTISFPNLPECYNRHFIRGVFDADGCIYVSKKGHKRWSIHSASPTFKDRIFDIITQSGIRIRKTKNQKGRNLEIAKKEDILKIHRFLYRDATIYLSRKESKFGVTA